MDKLISSNLTNKNDKAKINLKFFFQQQNNYKNKIINNDENSHNSNKSHQKNNLLLMDKKKYMINIFFRFYRSLTHPVTHFLMAF